MVRLSKTIVSAVCAVGMVFGTFSPAAVVAEEALAAVDQTVVAEAEILSESVSSKTFSVAGTSKDFHETDVFYPSAGNPNTDEVGDTYTEHGSTDEGQLNHTVYPDGDNIVNPYQATAHEGAAIPESEAASKESTYTEDITSPETKTVTVFSTVPELTSTPESTDSPELTSTPQSTAAPEETAAPESTAAPEDTTVPAETVLDAVERFVDSFYVCFLGRHAEPEGLAYWTSSLKDNTRTAADVAAGIMFSAESSVVGQNDRQFVIALYQAILNREPREDEIQVWVEVLDRAFTRKKIVDGFFGSDEFEETCRRLGIKAGTFISDDIADLNHDVAEFVVRFYKVCLNRRFDKEGLDSWIRALVNGEATGALVAWGFLDSEEYKALNRSDENYIEDLYRTFLGRTSDAEGKENWLRIAGMNFTRKYLAQGFVGSDEFGELCKAAGIKRGSLELQQLRDLNSGLTELINGFYKNLLQKNNKVAVSDIEYWINKALKDKNIVDIIKSFFNSDEYKGRKTSAVQFVKDVYRCLLFREPEDSTLRSRSQELKNGVSSRDAMLQSIISSEEFRIICESKGIPLVVEGWSNGKYYMNGKAYTGWKYIDGFKRYYKSGVLLTDLDDVLGNTKNYVLKINRTACTVTAYAYNSETKKYDIPAKVSVCTPGAADTPTTAGTFYISDQYRWKELMGPCWGQWCSRFNGGMLFHSVYYDVSGNNKTLSVSAYNNLGKAGSHGCCRVPASMAYWIYYHCSSGTKVVVYDSTDPGPLGKPATIKLPSWHTWDPTDPTAYKYCQEKGCH